MPALQPLESKPLPIMVCLTWGALCGFGFWEAVKAQGGFAGIMWIQVSTLSTVAYLLCGWTLWQQVRLRETPFAVVLALFLAASVGFAWPGAPVRTVAFSLLPAVTLLSAVIVWKKSPSTGALSLVATVLLAILAYLLIGVRTPNPE